MAGSESGLESDVVDGKSVGRNQGLEDPVLSFLPSRFEHPCLFNCNPNEMSQRRSLLRFVFVDV